MKSEKRVEIKITELACFEKLLIKLAQIYMIHSPDDPYSIGETVSEVQKDLEELMKRLEQTGAHDNT